MAHHTGNIFPSSSPAYRSNLKRKETNKRTTTTPQFLGPTGAGSLAKRWPCANCISFPYASPCALRKSWNSRRWSWNPWSPAICCEVVLFCFVGGKQRWLACGESQEKYRGRKGGKVKAPPGWSWETPPGYSSLFFLLELDICFLVTQVIQSPWPNLIFPSYVGGHFNQPQPFCKRSRGWTHHPRKKGHLTAELTGHHIH